MATPRMRRPTRLWCLLAGLGLAMPSLAAGAAADWNFSVLLDAKPIGTHRFELKPSADGERMLTSDAQFEVKFLGFTAYRYRHRAQESWRGDCLHSISARTDDDGEVMQVEGQTLADGFQVIAGSGKQAGQTAAPGCMVSFAYWNRAQLARQTHLLDQGTGRIEAVTITALPASTIEVQGKPTAVTGLRITGLKAPIDVWYDSDRWVGLDTTAGGKRKLTYRLP